jgi:hypothetical protein
MRKPQTNTDRLCAALNEMGIKTSIPRGAATKHNLISRSLRETEKARRRAASEIAEYPAARIGSNQDSSIVQVLISVASVEERTAWA